MSANVCGSAADGVAGTEARPADVQHTAEPWFTHPDGALTKIYGIDNQGRHVVIAKDVGHIDARLMRAAPEMLKALKEAERFLDYFANGRTMFVGGGMPLDALAMVRAALTKAGE